jgi:polysaccharide biosynthesis/export protein
LQCGGFLESASYAFVEIARGIKDSVALTKGSSVAQIFKFPIDRNLKLSDSASKFILKPFDVVNIRRSPGYSKPRFVSITGEANFPGSYSLREKNNRISDLIKWAGGLSKDAYLQDVVFKRGSTIISTFNIKLEKILKKPGSRRDLFLQEGDALDIPKVTQTVSITGCVRNPTAVNYLQSDGVINYVRLADGFMSNASRANISVIKPDSTVDHTKKILFFNKYPKVPPGSQIIVATKFEVRKARREKNNSMPKKIRQGMTQDEIIAYATGMSSLALIVVTLYNAFSSIK